MLLEKLEIMHRSCSRLVVRRDTARDAGSTSAACSGARCGLLVAACVLLVTFPCAASDPVVPESAGVDLTPARLLDDIESTAREKQERLLQLRQRLQRLTEESRRAAQLQADAATDDPAHAAPESPPDPHAVPQPPDEDPSHPPEPADSGHDHPLAADGSAVHDAAGEHALPPDSNHPPVTTHATETVVGSSINRLALGDSLFGTDQTDLALQAYQGLDLTKLPPSDRYWVEYQLANCHRRLGDIPEAQQRYRRLAGLVDAGWCASHSRWWLDALNTRTTLERDLAAVKTSMKSIEEQLNAEPAQ